MYNRYIPNGANYTRITMQDDVPPQPTPPQPEPDSSHRETNRSSGFSALLAGLSGNKKNAGLAGIFDALKLDDIDTGDILLLLILLFLFRDGEDLELVILLALILLLGLGDKEKSEETQDS